MKRAFTVVEVLVVVIVLAAIITVSITGYSAYRVKSQQAELQTLANSVHAAAEKYYDRNNIYPSGNELSSTNVCNSAPNYANAKTQLLLEDDVLTKNRAKFTSIGVNSNSTSGIAGQPCASAALNKENVYYLTRYYTSSPAVSHSSARVVAFNGCNYTFGTSSGTGSTAFIIAYWNFDEDKWWVTRSINGSVTTANTTTCPFNAN